MTNVSAELAVRVEGGDDTGGDCRDEWEWWDCRRREYENTGDENGDLDGVGPERSLYWNWLRGQQGKECKEKEGKQRGKIRGSREGRASMVLLI